MSDENKIVWSACAGCGRETRHDILFSYVKSEYEYRMDDVYSVVRCCGCFATSFRRQVFNFEDAYPKSNGDWDVPTETYLYPSVLIGHKELSNDYAIPIMIGGIYRQTVKAIQDGSYTLAGIGLRTTVEAICKSKKITGRTLEKRIDGLAKSLVSKKDVERLHALRFMGNDAAHDIKPADIASLMIALRIVEHLIISLYVLDYDADGTLETIIKDYGQFKLLLESKLSLFNSLDEYPLAKFLEKDVRRLHGYMQEHEASLVAEIRAGGYSKLTLGRIDNFNNSSGKLQHFVVV